MKVHFTRNWEHVVCNRAVACGDHLPVVSDPKLLRSFMEHPQQACRNCVQAMTPDERMELARVAIGAIIDNARPTVQQAESGDS